MPTPLLDALQRLAKARGYTSPALIIAAREQPKRSRPVLYWIRNDDVAS